MLMYNPLSWYWMAEDGRLYSSASGSIISASDDDFLAFTASGGHPTPWPRDGVGAQTQEALDAVLWQAGVPGVTPQEVSSAQAKIALIRAGHMPAVKAAVSEADEETQVWFTDARTWERHHPAVVAIGAGLGLSAAEIDALFVQAAAILPA